MIGENELLDNLEKLHTTKMGVERIKRNLSLDTDDVVQWCREQIGSARTSVTRKGKNWYVSADDCVITVNAYSYTIITAHRERKQKRMEKKRMVEKAELKDISTVANLAVLMWDDNTAEDLIREFTEIYSKGKAQFFLKYEDDIPVGFAQCQLRSDYVEGTETSPVGYLEGIFVREEYRHKGYAKELLDACEAWAGEQGCREFASDCELENTGSYRFHLAVGFAEANRIICFTKKL